jgi:hypothetical protein
LNDKTSKIRKFVFRIRKRYYDLIVAGTKKIEYRRDIPFWQTRIANIFSKEAIEGNFQLSCNLSGVEVQAVFICGKRKHVRELTGIERLKTPDYFSEQGKKDVNTPTCLGFHLGEVI